MNLRNKVVQISNLPKKNNADQASTSKSHKTIVDKESDDKEKSHDEVVREDNPKENVTNEHTQNEVLNKDVSTRNDYLGYAGKNQFGIQKELLLPEKYPSSFEVEISKVKISLPFNEILKNS